MAISRQKTLHTKYKVLVVLGELLLTPLLGAALYYAWKKDYPRKARFANISAWCVFAFYLFGAVPILSGIGSLFQQYSASSEIAQVHPDEREALRAIYDDIAGFDTDGEGHVTVVQYAPMSRCKSLKSLVAFQTEHGGGLITKAGLEHLQKIDSLQHLDVRGIDLSDAEAASLRESFPDCEILIEESHSE